MLLEILSVGFFVAFLGSRVGTGHQYFKYKNKKGKKDKQKISANYRGLDNLLYLSELAWGLSIQPISLTITIGNAVSLLFPSLILLEIWKDRRDKTVIYWCFIYAVFITANLTLILLDWPRFQEVSEALGILVIIFCFCSLWGMVENILLIQKYGNPGRQSLPEIYLKIFKDAIGLAYCFVAGINTMLPLAVALLSRGIMRLIHLGFYLNAKNNIKNKNQKKSVSPESEITPTQAKLQQKNTALLELKKELAKGLK
ncbi:MAG: hypothetical protein QNJ38_04890 [Prochloraceae cyanobacterium]|nr:hypothetical protein [Prochloraceae cyanobacterium]